MSIRNKNTKRMVFVQQKPRTVNPLDTPKEGQKREENFDINTKKFNKQNKQSANKVDTSLHLCESTLFTSV